MLITLYGPDAYRRLQYQREAVKTFVDKHPTAPIERFFLDERNELEQLREFIADQSLFAKTKLGIISDLENLESSKEDRALIASLVSAKTTSLILIFDKKPTKEFGFLLKKPAIAKTFEPLKGAQLVKFIATEAEARGAPLTPASSRDLAAAFGSDTWAIATELDKLALGASTEQQFAVPQFFPLIQQLRGGRTLSERLTALEYLLDNEEPAAVFNIAAALMRGKQKIQMADYDISIKSGKIEYPEALLDLVLQS